MEELEYLPAGQDAQDVAPATANVPAVQLVHANPLDLA